MAEDVYLPSRKVLNRYSRKSPVWLHRILKNDPDFPKPIYINGQKYWRLAELEAYDGAPERRIAPASPKKSSDGEAA